MNAAPSQKEFMLAEMRAIWVRLKLLQDEIRELGNWVKADLILPDEADERLQEWGLPLAFVNPPGWGDILDLASYRRWEIDCAKIVHGKPPSFAEAAE
jgi:hypothetical protein